MSAAAAGWICPTWGLGAELSELADLVHFADFLVELLSVPSSRRQPRGARLAYNCAFVTFTLRRTDFHGLVVAGEWRLKLYAISADGQGVPEQLRDGAVETARSHLPAGSGCGFLIVHRGEDATWLLVHWWQGDILCQHLLRAGGTAGGFEPAEDHLFACVWELHVIDHERRSWAINGLDGSPEGLRRYLGDAMTVQAGAFLDETAGR
ncbi:hypothetical protein [Saccharopolyspora soli]|uniref:hypothetical protein n=1 Tax=Saccharopolyspora soli TaxID=2926618 RepID=UPI001F56BD91|nr:hypothetical protein [Saccharopolyspora soli]